MTTPYDWLAKTYTNCYGHMTNMATMPIYGKNSLNLFSETASIAQLVTASIAQLVERPLSEREVVGSNPAAAPYQRCKKWY